MKNLWKTGIALSFALAMTGIARADILIGVAGPMTGEYATFGAQLKAGADQAVKDINKAGGVNGQMLKLEVGDDACDGKQAVSVANKLVSDGVVFVAGHFCSGSSIPASSVYSDADVIQISPASTNPAYTDQRPGPGTFRVCGRDDQQGQIAGQFLAKHFMGKNIAIVDDKTTYGKGLADQTRKFMNEAGLKEKIDDAVNAGEKDYTALVSKLKAANIDVLYYGGYHTEAGLIKRQMVAQGMKTLLMSGDALVTNEYWQITGDAGNGTLMTFSPDPRKNPEAKPIVDEMQAAGETTEGYALYSYAAVKVWADAANKAGSTDFNKVVKALDTDTFNTVLGKLNFDKNGDVTLPGYKVYEWKNGKYDYTTM